MKQKFKNEKRNKMLLLIAILMFFVISSICACADETSAITLEPQPLCTLTDLPPVNPKAPQSYINITENYIFRRRSLTAPLEEALRYNYVMLNSLKKTKRSLKRCASRDFKVLFHFLAVPALSHAYAPGFMLIPKTTRYGI